MLIKGTGTKRFKVQSDGLQCFPFMEVKGLLYAEIGTIKAVLDAVNSF